MREKQRGNILNKTKNVGIDELSIKQEVCRDLALSRSFIVTVLKADA